jgi:hypothetical protein
MSAIPIWQLLRWKIIRRCCLIARVSQSYVHLDLAETRVYATLVLSVILDLARMAGLSTPRRWIALSVFGMSQPTRVWIGWASRIPPLLSLPFQPASFLLRLMPGNSESVFGAIIVSTKRSTWAVQGPALLVPAAMDDPAPIAEVESGEGDDDNALKQILAPVVKRDDKDVAVEDESK